MADKEANQEICPCCASTRGAGTSAPPIHASMHEKRSVAKVGMTVAMGATVATGLMKGRGGKILHIWSGMALMGFSMWHYNLYQRHNGGH